jgi:methionyl-tRNA formyltransferase
MQPYKIIYAGTPDFAVPALKALQEDPRFKIVAVLTQPDRRAGRGQKLQTSPVKKFALAHALPLWQPLSLKEIEIQQIIRTLKPDAFIVAAYGLLLPSTVLEIPHKGCINIHGSLLPHWRGAAPVQRAIEQGDQETGISIMQMEKGLDTGPVFYTKTCPITATDTSLSLIEKLAQLGAAALMESLPDILAGQVSAIPQNQEVASYAKKLEKSEGLIDWQEDAEILARRIRAFTPWPSCYFQHKDQMIKIGAAYVVQLDKATAPGTILKQDAHGIVIACKNHGLCLTQLQLPGGKMMPAQNLII